MQWQDCWHTSMATCSLPGAARHPQPCHAQLPSLPGSLAVVWRCVDSSDPAASTSTACRSAASRRQAWTLAACRRFGQLVAETSPDGHHTAAGRILPRQVTVRAANAGSAHRSESYFSSQVGSDIRLRAGVLSHWLSPGDSRVFCPDAEGQLIYTYTVTPTAALLPAPPQPEASQQPALPTDLRPVLVMEWDPTRPWHPRHMGPQAHAIDAAAALNLSQSWPSSSVPGQLASQSLRASAASLPARSWVSFDVTRRVLRCLRAGV